MLLSKPPLKVLNSATAKEVLDNLEQLNEAMAAATELESTDAYINAGEEYQILLSRELYTCQNLIDRFQMHLINKKSYSAMLESEDTSIYLSEVKAHTIKLNTIAAELE